MTTIRHTWTVGSIDHLGPHLSGSTSTLAEAWLDALATGRAALLAGELDALAVAIDRELEALYTPRPDHAGALDPAEVTETLLGFYQGATAPAVIAALTVDEQQAR